MAITRVGVSDFVASSGPAGSPQTVSVTLPAGVQENDYIFALCVSNYSGGDPTFTFDTAGWTDLGLSSNGNLTHRAYRKIAGASEPNPQVTVSEQGGGFSVTIVVYRGVDTTQPEDIAVADDQGSGLSLTWQPASLTPVTDEAWVLQTVMVDEGPVDLDTANGHTLIAGSFDYHTTAGGEHGIGMADIEVPTVQLTEAPIFSQPTQTLWTGIGLVLRPLQVTGTQITRTVGSIISGDLVPS